MRKTNYFFLILIFAGITSVVNAQTWTQIGADIDGEAASDRSGSSVSLNSDGSVVAIGAEGNDGNGSSTGQVRIYQNNTGTWTQVGQDIDGEAEENYSGTSVSLNSDGSVLAIGAAWNNENGYNSGHVRIYENIAGTWIQVGADIDGEASNDRSGSLVSLSSDGSIVAISAEGNDGNGNEAGHVRIYQNIAGTWRQIGSDIDGEAADDKSGTSLSLSSDGSVVAIGAMFNDGNETSAGHVRIYQNIAGTWIQVGTDIDGEAEKDYFGASVSLNSDGSIVAIGASGNDGNGTDAGHVCIYQNIAGTWTQIGADIDGESSNDHSGSSVSLSSDGLIVAIGAYGNDENGSNSGHVRIFKNNSGTWTQIGNDINGEAASDESGYSVNLSSDGSMAAIGALYNDGNGSSAGHVRIYNLLMPPTVTSQPVNQINICSGAETKFSVQGENIDTYQWQVSENNGSTWTNVSNNSTYSGTETNELTILSDIDINNYQYRCNLLNDNGNTPSNAATLSFETEDPATPILEDIKQECSATITAPTTTDNCAGTITGTTIDPTEYSEQGTFTITWIFDDGNGNNIDVDQKVTIEDETNPTVSCVNNQTKETTVGEIFYKANGTEFDPATSVDNCEIESITNDFNNNNSLNGAEFPVGTTSIIWTIEDVAGNTTSCSFNVTIDQATGINNLEKLGVSIYPNPINNMLNITFNKENIKQIRIIDITGKTFIEKTDISEIERIDMSGFNSGIYFIQINSGEKVYSSKIIKK